MNGWTTPGLKAGADLAGGASDYGVTSATPSPLIVTFVLQSEAGAPPTAAPADAGAHD